MRRLMMLLSTLMGAMLVAVVVPPMSGCGGTGSSIFGDGGAGNGGHGGNGGGGGIHLVDSGGGSGGSGGSGGAPVCPPGLKCNVSCSGGSTTTISGKVYDPAGRNPLYNIAVYVPAAPLTALPKGVPTGSDACQCGALFKSGAVVSASTAVDGTFTLKNAPVGSSVPLVLQVGKWRKLVHINVTACTDNAQPDRSLLLPNSVPAGDTDDNMPDIAVSTGGADTLECLMTRIGLPASEYVAGTGTTGHIHVFSGGSSGFGGGGVGHPEQPSMAGAPPSYMDLWANQSQLMPYDITLLSCEGGETYNANPPALEAYLNAGGRVFASHYHYAWFSGPIGSGQGYSAPSDWGTNLASWTPGSNMDNGAIGGAIVQTLNGSAKPFPKGVALSQWLMNLGALGQGGVPGNELSIYQSRYNARVTAANTPSQPWISADSMSSEMGATMYFSFDTPVNPPMPGQYCGRAVFSDLHVDGDPSTNDNPPPPGGCATGALSPQEKALEFMLFDLSSCVIPDSQPPSDGGLPPPPPK